jgi:hypothetical protein
MDDAERRIAALDAALAELGASIDPGALDDAARLVREAVGRGDTMEAAIHLGATALLQDARCRFNRPAHEIEITRWLHGALGGGSARRQGR